MKKSIISALLSAAIFISSVGISVFAEEEIFPGSDPIDVVFLGGSITEGTSGSFGTDFPSGAGYATYVDEYLKQTYGTSRVKYHNSGIGGTGSDFGFNRIYDECIKYNPELVFVEFAVNDYWAGESTKSRMEAIVRSLQTMENPPYIVFVYTAQHKSGESDLSSSTKAISYQQEIADYYNIPSVNLSENVYKPYVEKRISEGIDQETAIKEFLSMDFVHPTANGHKLYGEYIIEKLKTDGFLKKAEVKTDWCVSSPKYDYVPKSVEITPDMINGSYEKSSDGKRFILDTGSSLSYKFSGPTVSAYMIWNADGGKYDVSIDGKVVMEKDGRFSGGYDQRILGFWVSDLKADTLHTLRLTVKTGKLNIKNLYTAETELQSGGISAIADNQNGNVTVTASGIDVSNGENATVVVLYPGKNAKAVAAEDIALIEQCKINEKGFTLNFTLDADSVSGIYPVSVKVFNDNTGIKTTSFSYENLTKKNEAEEALESATDMYEYLNEYLKYVDGEKNVIYEGLTEKEKRYAAGLIKDKSKLKEQLGMGLERISVLKKMKAAEGEQLEGLLSENHVLLDISDVYASYYALGSSKREITINYFRDNLKKVELPDGIGKALSDAIAAANAYTPSNPGGNGGGGGGSGSGGSSYYGAGTVTNPGSDKLLPVPEEKAVFSDLDKAPWAIEAITALYKMGVINGKTETEFYPNDYITREEFVKLVVSAFDMQDEVSNVSFKDVDNSAWYAKYISIALKKNIVKGISAEEFGTGTNIKRQDLLLMLDRVVDEEENVQANVVDEDIYFEDTDKIDSYAIAAVYRMVRAKVAQGDENGLLNPQSGATRAEAVQMIYNLLKK